MGLGIFAFLVFALRWTYFHRNDEDFRDTVVGFADSWIPFALSLVIAYIVDLKEKHWSLTAVIVGIGLVWSVIAWEDKKLSLEATRRQHDDIMNALNQANDHTDATVGKANAHTDHAVEGANQHTDSQVAMVRDDLKKATEHSDKQIAGVKSDLTDLFSKTEKNLDASIGKVGKPDPPIPPKISFTLWADTATVDHPVQASSLSPDSDGVFTVEFTAGNYSPTTAHSVDIWIDICTECSYAKEPDSFDRPAGMRDQTRHRMIPLMNRGTSIGKMAIQLKVSKPLAWFQVDMRYSCESCEGMSAPQVATITILPPLPKQTSQ